MPPTKSAAARSAAIKRAENARKAKRKKVVKHKPKLEAIDPAKCYPLPVFHEVSGLGPSALTQAQKDGLVVKGQGSRKYVIGADFIEYLNKKG